MWNWAPSDTAASPGPVAVADSVSADSYLLQPQRTPLPWPHVQHPRYHLAQYLQANLPVFPLQSGSSFVFSSLYPQRPAQHSDVWYVFGEQKHKMTSRSYRGIDNSLDFADAHLSLFIETERASSGFNPGSHFWKDGLFPKTCAHYKRGVIIGTCPLCLLYNCV